MYNINFFGEKFKWINIKEWHNSFFLYSFHSLSWFLLWMVWLECIFGVCIHVWLFVLEFNEYVNVGVLSWVLMILWWWLRVWINEVMKYVLFMGVMGLNEEVKRFNSRCSTMQVEQYCSEAFWSAAVERARNGLSEHIECN